MDYTSMGLLGVATLLGGGASDLMIKGHYWIALAFIVILASCIGAREYFKID